MTDREKRDVERAAISVNHLANEVMRVGHERRVAGKEARFTTCVEQVHIRRASPAIERIPASLMPGCTRVDHDITNGDLSIRRKRSCL